MKTFTVRDLDREPSAVLDACDADGEIHIRRRDGRVYSLKAKRRTDPMTGVSQLRERLMRICPKPIPAKQARIVDRLIRGE